MKTFEIDSKELRQLFDAGRRLKSDTWQYVCDNDEWNGGEDRYQGYIFKNKVEGYYLDISNYYNSWDMDWDPVVNIVEPTKVTVTQYPVVKDTLVKIKYNGDE